MIIDELKENNIKCTEPTKNYTTWYDKNHSYNIFINMKDLSVFITDNKTEEEVKKNSKKCS